MISARMLKPGFMVLAFICVAVLVVFASPAHADLSTVTVTDVTTAGQGTMPGEAFTLMTATLTNSCGTGVVTLNNFAFTVTNVNSYAEEFIVGGVKNAGQGWKMLMESLAAGRGISLPAHRLPAEQPMAKGQKS